MDFLSRCHNDSLPITCWDVNLIKNCDVDITCVGLLDLSTCRVSRHPAMFALHAFQLFHQLYYKKLHPPPALQIIHPSKWLLFDLLEILSFSLGLFPTSLFPTSLLHLNQRHNFTQQTELARQSLPSHQRFSFPSRLKIIFVCVFNSNKQDSVSI